MRVKWNGAVILHRACAVYVLSGCVCKKPKIPGDMIALFEAIHVKKMSSTAGDFHSRMAGWQTCDEDV